MRDHDHRRSKLLVDFTEQGYYLVGRAAVEITGRLVRQEQRGPMDDRAGDSDALLFAAAEFGWPMGGPLRQADPPKGLCRTPGAFAAVNSLEGKRQGDIFQGG